MGRGTRIMDVERKPYKCPACGEEGGIYPIIYGTGDLTNVDLLFLYRKEACAGGDNIPRRPPIWECNYCGRRFRKVNFDGTDAPVKIRLLKNERKGKIKFTSTDEDGNQYQW